ncbi:MAG: hypothetical protein UU82_C0031G0008 [Candidatus Nomurabacteria bacterium GW2011_GWC2_41_8]|uniref:Uncharacterized protein n=2 Tax=Candidatus Nomuraibacteriota TaxID=1752729 RepID=A0A1F6YAF4_9BACT|nr:MAG: hypothetical protein UU82_C0031G0008 [Candidatus Nomurabacteria bacterium GW2011_GWC2_41_8]OGI66580.1 MAG: hypothetical protein A2823_00490 [Candidatus Nomurabacteria bacterium RIFCSPHIGHO2_01_FULL_41_91]OGI80726.1 MAG: hypothetical protein A3D43_02525 [Candidatus Nomurabacteria bacterium RIFCSPHIGHO2_02_FULL_41_52]OGI84628.1 MAG: hypothetical protein A3F49_02200 [Candidatus Nomurabacteria bacterium RIFCSPHIGHO2_12_FULL_42_19]OGI94007.1 MAG: hypothetical protein A3A07_00770 [Candidatus 
MIIALLSVLILTCVIWVLNKKLPIQVCSICAGVTLTWAWMLSGMWFGLLSVPRYEFITAILMGMSIGGIVTELKKLFLKRKNRTESPKAEEIKKRLDNCC